MTNLQRIMHCGMPNAIWMASCNQTLARAWIRVKSVNLYRIFLPWPHPLTIGWYTHTQQYWAQAWILGDAIFASFLSMQLRLTTFLSLESLSALRATPNKYKVSTAKILSMRTLRLIIWQMLCSTKTLVLLEFSLLMDSNSVHGVQMRLTSLDWAPLWVPIGYKE